MSFKPRKRFGQHFLTDSSVIHRIIGVIGPQPTDNMVEIGPGLGALTFHLLNIVQHLNVIELDRDLAAALKAKNEKLTVHQQDVLEFDFNTLAKVDKLRIVGNLPYNISTPIIFHLLQFSSSITDMYFMLQKEVVDRMVASSGSKDYGRLSVMVQYHCQADACFDVFPDAFNPPPKVNSTVMRLIPHQRLPFAAENYEFFCDIVKQAFSQRRKTLRNSLKEIVTDEDWEHLGISATKRAEELTVQDFVRVSNYVNIRHR